MTAGGPPDVRLEVAHPDLLLSPEELGPFNLGRLLELEQGRRVHAPPSPSFDSRRLSGPLLDRPGSAGDAEGGPKLTRRGHRPERPRPRGE